MAADVKLPAVRTEIASSVTYAFRGCAADSEPDRVCPSRDAECTDIATSNKCWSQNITSEAQDDCQDELSCKVQPPGQSTCSDEVELPGYMGCFKLEDVQNVTDFNVTSNSMTIQRCLDRCRREPETFLLAALGNGTTCRCWSRLIAMQSVSTSHCNVSCAGDHGGDRSQSCGGANHVDIYSASVGQCGTGDKGRIRDGNYGVIYSPGFPDKYPNLNRPCTWIVSVQEDKVIKVTLHLLNLGDGDSLLLRDGINRHARLLTTSPLTRSNIPPRINASSSNNIWIRFRSDNTSRGRFILKYTALDHCGKINVTERGEVSPDHNGNFGIGETARIDCKNESLSLVVVCQETTQFNVTPPYCNGKISHLYVRAIC
ncbi:Kremen protein 1 [Branchiostoma belcheri]|nr:Kremen protein 1 [Branchiostoma belcheri]